MEWTKIGNPVAIGGGSWGYRIDYRTEYEGKELILNLTHLNNEIPLTVIKSLDQAKSKLIPGLSDLNYLINTKEKLNSGEQVGTYSTKSPINHLHIGLTVDGKLVEPIQEIRMCGQ